MIFSQNVLSLGKGEGEKMSQSPSHFLTFSPSHLLTFSHSHFHTSKQILSE